MLKDDKNTKAEEKKDRRMNQEATMEKLRETPRNGPNIKTMQGFQNRFRYRIGDFRVVYEIIDNELVIWVLEADWRGNIY